MLLHVSLVVDILVDNIVQGSVSLLIFCKVLLSVIERVLLKSLIVIVDI